MREANENHSELMADGAWLLARAEASRRGDAERPSAKWLEVLGYLDDLGPSGAIEAVVAWYERNPPPAGSRSADRLAAVAAARTALRELGKGAEDDDLVIQSLRGALAPDCDPVLAFGLEMRADADRWADHLYECVQAAEAAALREAMEEGIEEPTTGVQARRRRAA